MRSELELRVTSRDNVHDTVDELPIWKVSGNPEATEWEWTGPVPPWWTDSRQFFRQSA